MFYSLYFPLKYHKFALKSRTIPLTSADPIILKFVSIVIYNEKQIQTRGIFEKNIYYDFDKFGIHEIGKTDRFCYLNSKR